MTPKSFTSKIAQKKKNCKKRKEKVETEVESCFVRNKQSQKGGWLLKRGKNKVQHTLVGIDLCTVKRVAKALWKRVTIRLDHSHSWKGWTATAWLVRAAKIPIKSAMQTRGRVNVVSPNRCSWWCIARRGHPGATSYGALLPTCTSTSTAGTVHRRLTTHWRNNEPTDCYSFDAFINRFHQPTVYLLADVVRFHFIWRSTDTARPKEENSNTQRTLFI